MNKKYRIQISINVIDTNDGGNVRLQESAFATVEIEGFTEMCALIAELSAVPSKHDAIRVKT